jgi:putative membrane protein
MKTFVAAIGLLCVAAAAAAVGPTAESFTTDAVSAGMTEVALSRLAIQKSTSPTIKAFAHMMIKDHSEAGAKLKAIAKTDKIPVPSAPMPEQQAVAKDLSAKSGPAFDAAYAAQMVKDHEKAVTLFTAASDDADLQPNLRTFAAKTLPKLAHHLDEAKKLNDKLVHDAGPA